jgi:hypothetical protein
MNRYSTDGILAIDSKSDTPLKAATVQCDSLGNERTSRSGQESMKTKPKVSKWPSKKRKSDREQFKATNATNRLICAIWT